MKFINLNGKYAIGNRQKTIVDDEDFERYSKYKWKAKPNANKSHVYAVRNIILKNGKSKTLRLHREILGVPWDGKLDIDHINRDSLDNRKTNLRLVTRSVNISNTSEEIKLLRLNQQRYAAKIAQIKNQQKRWGRFSLVEFKLCIRCGEWYRKRKKNHNYCSRNCRVRSNNWYHYRK